MMINMLTTSGGAYYVSETFGTKICQIASARCWRYGEKDERLLPTYGAVSRIINRPTAEGSTYFRKWICENSYG